MLQTKRAAEQYRYGRWAGLPQGKAYDPECCAFEVEEAGRGFHVHQCFRSPGHGPDKLYCKQHDPVASQKRQAKRDAERSAKWDAEMKRAVLHGAARTLLAALEAAPEPVAKSFVPPKAHDREYSRWYNSVRAQALRAAKGEKE